MNNLLIIFISILLVACSKEEFLSYEENRDSKGIEQGTKDEMDKRTTNIPEQRQEEQEKEIVLSFVGDIMIHRPQLTRAYVDGVFDFSSSFETIEEYIETANYTIVNLETTLSGKDEGVCLENSNYYMGYQGFPTFNSPEILAKNLKDTGFDMITTGNNHSFDGWTGGIVNTIDNLNANGLDHVGTYKNTSDERVLIKEIEGIKIAFLNYTYSTNGIIPPPGSEYMVNTLNNYDEEYIKVMYQEINDFTTNHRDIDLTVVSIHFGLEYHLEPSDIQTQMCENMIKAGADVIIGSHPHVLQPVDILEVQLEDGSMKKGVVAYSLGNFLSSQIYLRSDPVPKNAGIILNLTINKDENKGTYVNKIGLVPTWVQWTNDTIRVIPVSKAIKLYYEDNYYNLSQKDYDRLLQVQDFTIPHLASEIVEDLDNESIINDEEYIINIR